MPVVVHALDGDLPAADVVAGRFDDRLGAPVAAAIRVRARESGWFRVSTPVAVDPAQAPKLVLRSPFIDEVEVWVPGGDGPRRHGLYGDVADPRYAHRALVVDLPRGLLPDDAVWLHVQPRSAVSMPVAIEPMARVHRDDLAFVAWRAFILAVLLVLALLALAFWVGVGEASYGWFGGMLIFAMFYLVAIGGDLRLLPGAELLFGSTAQSNRIVGGLGVLCSNMFQRAYLDLPGKLRVLDRLLSVGSALAVFSVAGSIFLDAGWLAYVGNIGLLLSAGLLMVGSIWLSLRGDRPGRVVMVSWLPLMAFTTLVASEMLGFWYGPIWLEQGLAGSFALAGLLLTIGLADKLLELRRDRDQASAQARADDLTGMYNRAGVEAELRQVMAEATARGMPMSIAFVDLDHFKRINDAFGHSIGDQCLRIVAQRVRNQLRGRDIIGRYGGDEFLVVLPDTRLEDAVRVSGRMLASVNCRPLTMDEMQLDATLSIGVAEFVSGESPEALFERADAALYASKQAGRNRVSATSGPTAEAAPV